MTGKNKTSAQKGRILTQTLQVFLAFAHRIVLFLTERYPCFQTNLQNCDLRKETTEDMKGGFDGEIEKQQTQEWKKL